MKTRHDRLLKAHAKAYQRWRRLCNSYPDCDSRSGALRWKKHDERAARAHAKYEEASEALRVFRMSNPSE